MKKIILIFITTLFIGCDTTQNGVLVTFDDEKSNAIRAHYQNYLNNDVEALQSLWSPDLKIYINSTEAAGVEDISAAISAQHEVFENIKMSFGEEGGEDLGVWVQTIDYPATNGYEQSSNSQTWFTWSGKSKISGNEVVVPVFIGFQWKEGKIVQEWHHYDPTNLNAEMAMLSSE
tara:strand:+ start:265 stop:789 length:525 start_codon:yes stop_codon:yes gene_type:complete